MTPKINESLIRLAGMTCCSVDVTPLRKNRRLPGTVTGKPGVRHLAGTVFVDTILALKS
jgi:hypothetical protein